MWVIFGDFLEIILKFLVFFLSLLRVGKLEFWKFFECFLGGYNV